MKTLIDQFTTWVFLIINILKRRTNHVLWRQYTQKCCPKSARQGSYVRWKSWKVLPKFHWKSWKVFRPGKSLKFCSVVQSPGIFFLGSQCLNYSFSSNSVYSILYSDCSSCYNVKYNSVTCFGFLLFYRTCVMFKRNKFLSSYWKIKLQIGNFYRFFSSSAPLNLHKQFLESLRKSLKLFSSVKYGNPD